MSEEKVVFKYGVWGVGRMGRVHCQNLVQQGHEIICMGDENENCAKEAAGIFNVKSWFISPKDMIEKHGKELTAVVVASHSKDHAKDAKPFIDAKIPIYIEKPLTDVLSETFDFLEDVGMDRKVMQIGLQRRFDEALCFGKEIIEKGVIGKIREIRSVLRDQFCPPPTFSSPGLLVDMGIHVADEVIWLMGEFPNKIWAKLFEAIEYSSPIEEGGNTAFVGFTTASGIIGRLDLSRTHSSGYNNETYVIGTKGTLHIGRFCGYPGPIPVEVYNDKGQLVKEFSKTFHMPTDLKIKIDSPSAPHFFPRFKDAYYQATLEFQDIVKKGDEFRVTQMEILDAQVMCQAAALSAEKNGAEYVLERSDDLKTYRELCVKNKLM